MKNWFYIFSCIGIVLFATHFFSDRFQGRYVERVYALPCAGGVDIVGNCRAIMYGAPWWFEYETLIIDTRAKTVKDIPSHDSSKPGDLFRDCNIIDAKNWECRAQESPEPGTTKIEMLGGKFASMSNDMPLLDQSSIFGFPYLLFRYTPISIRTAVDLSVSNPAISQSIPLDPDAIRKY